MQEELQTLFQENKIQSLRLQIQLSLLKKFQGEYPKLNLQVFLLQHPDYQKAKYLKQTSLIYPNQEEQNKL